LHTAQKRFVSSLCAQNNVKQRQRKRNKTHEILADVGLMEHALLRRILLAHVAARKESEEVAQRTNTYLVPFAATPKPMATSFALNTITPWYCGVLSVIRASPAWQQMS
jgi:hypothetical protein